jgi:hypothetical protein
MKPGNTRLLGALAVDLEQRLPKTLAGVVTVLFIQSSLLTRWVMKEEQELLMI